MAGSDDQFIRVPIALWDDTRLTGSEKLVMIALLRHFNREQQRSWPSQELIAQESGLSRKWIRGVLARLAEKGFITIFKGTGRGNVNQYAIDQQIFSLPKRGTQFQKKGNSVPEKGNSVPEKGNSVPTNQIKNQIKNQISEPELGELHSPDAWTAAQAAAIRKVVTAPRPANLAALLAQWRETYGEATVEKTIDRALRWLQDSGRRYRDMGRFIGGWLARDAESPREVSRRTGLSAPDYGDKPKSWRELMPAFAEGGDGDDG